MKHTIGCNQCDGSGEIETEINGKKEKIICPQCHGSGDGYVVDVSGLKNVKLNVKQC